jgi:GDPmannose 4,6-dehydratase
VRRALITGVSGQDGSYLAELLLARGYEVHGIVRRTSTADWPRLRHLTGRVHLHVGDMLDFPSLLAAVSAVRPDHVYNLAAQSSVAESFRQPLHTAEVVALGAARLFEAVRLAAPEARLYQASSSEMLGGPALPIGATGPGASQPAFHPRSPYAAAKVHAHHLAVNYRESHGMFVVCGLLYNHESPRRGPEFVTRRIARGVAAIAQGRARTLTLGNLEARRDWGWAPDYVAAMLAMLEQDTPQDVTVATGESWSVEEFAARAFAVAGLDWREHVRVDPALLRPADIPELRGDPEPARRVLGFRPTVGFDAIVARMVEAELRGGEGV